jgi:hypothetical protein
VGWVYVRRRLCESVSAARGVRFGVAALVQAAWWGSASWGPRGARGNIPGGGSGARWGACRVPCRAETGQRNVTGSRTHREAKQSRTAAATPSAWRPDPGTPGAGGGGSGAPRSAGFTLPTPHGNPGTSYRRHHLSSQAIDAGDKREPGAVLFGRPATAAARGALVILYQLRLASQSPVHYRN